MIYRFIAIITPHEFGNIIKVYGEENNKFYLLNQIDVHNIDLYESTAKNINDLADMYICAEIDEQTAKANLEGKIYDLNNINTQIFN